MRYLGGKTRIAKHIVAQLPDAEQVWEPFCGGLNMTLELAKRYKCVGASDLHPGPIALGLGLQRGWQPPTEVSEDDYRAAKLLPDTDPLKAFIGFGCSVFGQWFGSYNKGGIYVTRTHPKGMRQDPAGAANAFCSRLRPHLHHVSFAQLDFMQCQPDRSGLLIYCDPPYAGTTGYSTGPWNAAAFHEHCRVWARAGNRVFVSEYDAPFHLVWEQTAQKAINKTTRTERLYEVTEW